MYRAHIQVYDEKGDRLGAARLREFFPANVVGTRMGRPGLWIERRPKADFRFAVWNAIKATQAMGFTARVGLTNEPSFKAVTDFAATGTTIERA